MFNKPSNNAAANALKTLMLKEYIDYTEHDVSFNLRRFTKIFLYHLGHFIFGIFIVPVIS
jgi:hypothetical protein